MKLQWLLPALLAPCQVQAQAAFAHFMVGNTALFSADDWAYNINLARGSAVDAFALNMAYGWPMNDQAVALAFQAAEANSFQLFFSFDYAGNGTWPLDVVRNMIQQYSGSSAYYHYNGRPFVSTFEGPGAAEDWVQIKADTNCFFMPDWSSVGAGPAVALAGGVADGLFSWAAWPWGPNNMTTYVDASYLQALGDKPYMMPVSPWFYTNLPGYGKNWLWHGDDLWYHRWQQVFALRPPFIEIISWNDFGESHHIGPLDDKQYEAFSIGQAPYNYVQDRPHDAWRTQLPFLISTYKNNRPTVDTESLVTWFRTSKGTQCGTGGTTGNTATQLQLEFWPYDVMQDRIYFNALLTSHADLNVIYTGGNTYITEWDHTPDGGVGIYHTSIPMPAGGFEAVLVRNGQILMQIQPDVTTNEACVNGLTNWNPWVGGVSAAANPAAAPPRALSDQVCVEGWGKGNFEGVCEFTCKYGYCPVGACVCTNMGAALTLPDGTGVQGYPANGDANYGGLCSFACNFGYCPPEACSTTAQEPYIPTTSPFADDACRSGSAASGNQYAQYADLCAFTCSYGYCPIALCQCTATGPLDIPPAAGDASGASLDGSDDHGLCSFACSRSYCPTDVCSLIAPPNLHLPTSFLALGDSFSAGIGAGNFISQSTDQLDNPCARMSGSYPYQLWGLNPFESPIAWRDFYSCSGDVLDNMDGQFDRRPDTSRVDIATLSISGNDFKFGDVVKACVYPVSITGTNAMQVCMDTLDTAADLIDDATIWDKYRDKVTHIVNNILNPDTGILYITGYAQFFADPVPGDACDDLYFLDVRVIGNNLKMDTSIRLRMNTLVRTVNQKIQDEVVSQWPGNNVRWVDIDPNFEGRRFCEAAHADDPIGRGAQAHNVWFNDIRTQLEETGTWKPIAGNHLVDEWDEWASQIPADYDDTPGFGGRGILDKYQQSSSFHPKKEAHQRTAALIYADIILKR